MDTEQKNKVFSLDEGRLLRQIEKINEKVDLSNEFPNWNKSVQFIVKGSSWEDESAFFFAIEDGKVTRSGSGKLDEADVTIEGSAEAINNLFNGELPVIGAFITKQLIIKGKVGDAVGANVLLQAARTF